MQKYMQAKGIYNNECLLDFMIRWGGLQTIYIIVTT